MDLTHDLDPAIYLQRWHCYGGIRARAVAAAARNARVDQIDAVVCRLTRERGRLLAAEREQRRVEVVER